MVQMLQIVDTVQMLHIVDMLQMLQMIQVKIYENLWKLTNIYKKIYKKINKRFLK